MSISSRKSFNLSGRITVLNGWWITYDYLNEFVTWGWSGPYMNAVSPTITWTFNQGDVQQKAATVISWS